MSKQKVLLINPEETRGRFDFKGIIDDEPLELEIIYTVMKKEDIEVKIYDAIRPKGVSLEQVIKEFKPTVTYVNGIVKQIPFIKEYNRRIKKIDHNMKTIIGGVYAEHNFKNLYSDDVDYICRSYDPFVIIEVIQYLQNKEANLSHLNGLCFKVDNKWIENDIKPFDINLLPIPDRTYFYENIEEFRYLELTKIAQVRTSYSCPYNCNFCYRTSLNCGKYVAKEISKVVEEIKDIKTNHIYFVDDDFMFDRVRLLEFIELIKKEKINKKYVCYGRTDFIIKNKDLIKELKEIGFYYILVGLEAISDSFLNSYNKKTGKQQNEECIEYLNSIHLNCMGMMIVDLDFKKEDFVNMYQWVKQIGLKHVALSIFTPLPGSKLYKEYEDKLITNDLTKWDYVHLVVKPTNLGIKRFYFHYYILVFRLLNLAKKHGIYDFLDWKKLKKDFLTLLWKKE